MARREEALERQWAEVESLTAIFDGDECVALEFFNVSALQREIEKDDDKAKASKWKDVILLVRFRDRDIPCVKISLPETYPCGASPEVELTTYFLERKCSEELENVIATCEREGEESLFQIIQLLKDALSDDVRENDRGSSSNSSSDDDDTTIEACLPFDQDCAVDGGGGRDGRGGGRGEAKEADLVLGRRLCFSHHIIAPGKRSAVINWAIELNLGGCSKIGWPGLIAVEGDERNCQVYVQMLQRLRWKRFTVRGEQQVVCDKTQYQSIDSMRQLPKGFCEFQQDEMHLFAETLKRSGLEDLFMTSMKVYNSNPSQGDPKGGDRDGEGGDGENMRINNKQKKQKQKKKKKGSKT